MVFLPVVLPTIFDHAAAVRKQGIHCSVDPTKAAAGD
jgi:hypothetical protein